MIDIADPHPGETLPALPPGVEEGHHRRNAASAGDARTRLHLVQRPSPQAGREVPGSSALMDQRAAARRARLRFCIAIGAAIALAGLILLVGLIGTRRGAKLTPATGSESGSESASESASKSAQFQSGVPALPVSTAQNSAPAQPLPRPAPVEKIHHPPTSSKVNSLATGTEIRPDLRTTGRGELEAINDTDEDAFVIVTDVDNHVRVRQRYIKARDRFTMARLESGHYDVLFATGIDWNGPAERFNRHASYFELGAVLAFRETSDEANLYFQHRTITINSKHEGNVYPRELSEKEFHSLSGNAEGQ